MEPFDLGYDDYFFYLYDNPFYYGSIAWSEYVMGWQDAEVDDANDWHYW